MLFLIPPEIIKKNRFSGIITKLEGVLKYSREIDKKETDRNIISILDINWTRDKFTRTKYR